MRDIATPATPTSAIVAETRPLVKSWAKRLGGYIASSAFFLVLLIVQLILDIYTYELGHGVSARLGGSWQNNISVLGETFYTDPNYLNWLQHYLVAHHATLQQFWNNDLPSTFNTTAFIEALFQQQPGFLWGIAGAFLFQAAVSLLLFGYSRTRLYHRAASSAGKLFLSSFLVVSLADLSMRLVNAFTDGHGDDLWLLRVGIIGNNWLILGGIILAGALLAALALHIGRTQLAESLALVTTLTETSTRRAALGFTIGVLMVNFGVRFSFSTVLFPGILYSIVFFLLFMGTALYTGVTLMRSARASGATLHISGHLYVSYTAMLVCAIMLVALNVAVVTGANPAVIIGVNTP